MIAVQVSVVTIIAKTDISTKIRSIENSVKLFTKNRTKIQAIIYVGVRGEIIVKIIS